MASRKVRAGSAGTLLHISAMSSSSFFRTMSFSFQAIREASSENLSAMPLDEVASRARPAGERGSQRSLRELQEQLLHSLATANLLRHENPTLVVEPESASVERLVVEGAERDAVVLAIRPACDVPHDVRRLDSEVDRSELAVVGAHTTAVLVDPQD